MLQWIKNGAHRGWLIYSAKAITNIYTDDGTVIKIEGFNHTLSGENVRGNFSFSVSILLS